MNIIIFYHVFAVNNWQEIFTEQIEKLSVSGLLENSTLFINITSNDYNYAVAKSIVEKYNNIELIHNDVNLYEYPTLSNLKKYCDNNDCYVLYIHTKGVANTQFKENSKAWRNYMEYFCIEKWRDCIEKLNEGYDCCGVNYWSDMKTPHFSGNFFWANSDYIKKLPVIKKPEQGMIREVYELWVGQLNPKVHSFCDNGSAYYLTKIDEKEYK